MVAAVWTGFRFHIEFVGVKLEFLQSRVTPNLPGSLTRSLSLFDIQLSEFTFESHSDQTKTVDFTSNVVIVHDTRYEGMLYLLENNFKTMCQVIIHLTNRMFLRKYSNQDISQRKLHQLNLYRYNVM